MGSYMGLGTSGADCILGLHLDEGWWGVYRVWLRYGAQRWGLWLWGLIGREI